MTSDAEHPDRDRLCRLVSAARVKPGPGGAKSRLWSLRELDDHSASLGNRVPRDTWLRLLTPLAAGEAPHHWRPEVLRDVAATLLDLGAAVTLAEIETAALADYGYSTYATLTHSEHPPQLAQSMVKGLPGRADRLAIMADMLDVLARRDGSDGVLKLLAEALTLMSNEQGGSDGAGHDGVGTGAPTG